MAVTNYYSVNGQILGEASPKSPVRRYAPDALGTVAATFDTNGALENAYRFLPYGRLATKTGTAADPKFTWVGTLGYRQTGASWSELYVRARHYSPGSAGWTTVVMDGFRLLGEPAYGYAFQSPQTVLDAGGNQPKGRPGPTYDPTFWNQPSVRPYNNCYNYACNAPAGDYRQPGQLSGSPFDNFPNGKPSCANILANAKRDGLTEVDPRFRSGCPPGRYKICVYVSNGFSGFSDYHWYRQDNTGFWSDKPGWADATNCYPWPNQRIPITDPGFDAFLRGYYVKCGCLCAPTSAPQRR